MIQGTDSELSGAVLGQRRLAFSLLELVVVLGIMALVLALLLAAIQKVRAAAVRTQCANQLKQIGLALQLYHDIQGKFPPGLVDDWSSSQPLLSWMGRILPQIEQEALWLQTALAYQSDPVALNNPPHLGMTTLIPLYGCPGGAVPLLVNDGAEITAALTSYRGVSGTDLLAGNGVLYRNSLVRIVDIRDGTAFTLLVGESQPLNTGGSAYGQWYNGVGQSDGQRIYGSTEVLLGVSELNLAYGQGGFFKDCPQGPYAFGPGISNAPCDLFHFWSFHEGGANFLFADGAVHFLAYSAAPLLPALATRNGGEVLGDLPF